MINKIFAVIITSGVLLGSVFSGSIGTSCELYGSKHEARSALETEVVRAKHDGAKIGHFDNRDTYTVEKEDGTSVLIQQVDKMLLSFGHK